MLPKFINIISQRLKFSLLSKSSKRLIPMVRKYSTFYLNMDVTQMAIVELSPVINETETPPWTAHKFKRLFKRLSFSNRPGPKSRKQSKPKKASLLKRTLITQAKKTAALTMSLSNSIAPEPNFEDCSRIQIETNLDAIKYGPYTADIYTYLKDEEARYDIPGDFLKDKKNDTIMMRNIVADWLIRVHSFCKLRLETYFLAIAIMDRYIRVHDLAVHDFKVLGVTALFIATKYEETFQPRRKPFGVATDHFKLEEITEMEIKILKALEFKLSFPVPVVFFRLFCKVSGASYKEEQVGRFIMELCTCAHELATCRPSLYSASAMYLALRVNRPGCVWSEQLILASEYYVQDLLPVVQVMCDHLLKSDSPKYKFTAAKDKYSGDKFNNASLMPELYSGLIKGLAKN